MSGGTLQDMMAKEIDGGARIATENDRTQDANGKIAATQHRASELADTTQHSAPLNTMAQPAVRKAMEEQLEATVPAQPDVSDEVLDLLSQTNENGTLYEHPRHFAQVGNRQGFTLYIPTRNADGPSTLEVVFERGVFSTNDVQLVAALHKAIKRKDGVSAQIREISLSHYRTIIERGRAYQSLKGIGGLVNTGDTRPSTGGKSAIDLQTENDSLRKQLEEARSQALRASETNETDAGKTNGMFGN